MERRRKNFNTSYVKVHQTLLILYSPLILYFNTSYVKVHPNLQNKQQPMFVHFNTSYVKVHQTKWQYCLAEQKFISIHLMLRFIRQKKAMEIIRKYFNTSYVKVHLRLLMTVTAKSIDFNTSYVKVHQKNR